MWAAFISSGGGSLVTCEYLPSVTRAKSYRVLLNAAVTKRRDVSVVIQLTYSTTFRFVVY